MPNVSLQEAFDFIDSKATEYGVDPETAKAILLSENYGANSIGKARQNPGGFTLNSELTSRKGARGLMQVMPATLDGLKGLGYVRANNNMDSWQDQIEAGLGSLNESQTRLGITDPKMLAADYNAGPRGSKALRDGTALPNETNGYLAKMDLALSAPNTGASQIRAAENTISGSPSSTVTAGLGAESLMKILENSNIWIKEQIALITTSSEQEQAAHNAAALAVQQAGAATAQAAMAKGAIEGAAVQARERALAITNLDTRKADNRLAINVAEFDQIDAQRRVLAGEIDARMAVGFFDNPLEWLMNQTILPGQVEQHNAMARRQNDSLSAAQVMQNLTKNQESIDIAASADQIAEYGVHIGNAAVAGATAKAERYKAEAAGASARKSLAIASLVDRNFDNAAKVLHWQELATREKEGKALKVKEQEEIADLDSKIRRLAAPIGSEMNFQQFKRLSKKQQDQWLERVSNSTYGNNLHDAIRFIRQYGNPQKMAASGNAEVGKLLLQMEQDLVNRANLEGQLMVGRGEKVLPREEMLDAAGNLIQKELFASQNDMIHLAKPGNPYLIDHAATIKGWKGKEGNPVHTFVSAAYKQGGVKMTDQQIFTAVSAQILAGKLDVQTASQALADYYGEAVRRNNAARSFPLFGLNEQKDYWTLPKEVKLKVNLLDPNSIEHQLTSFVVKAKTASTGFGGVGWPPINPHFMQYDRPRKPPTEEQTPQKP